MNLIVQDVILEPTYIGSTRRLLKNRIAAHLGISHRTGVPLNTTEPSAIRQHCPLCKVKPANSNFKILARNNDITSLLITESLYIKQKRPKLKSDLSSHPLYIA